MEAGILASQRQAQNRRALRRLLRELRVWPVDHETARFYGGIYADLRKQGRVLSQVDMMVAALARQMDLVVVTTDQDFQWVSGLQTENWMPPPP
jgi:tRNA(fMet)-specific endonuclease VapC